MSVPDFNHVIFKRNFLDSHCLSIFVTKLRIPNAAKTFNNQTISYCIFLPM